MQLGVTLVLQNNTNELLTIEACDVVVGGWVVEQEPRREDVVVKQGSGKWATVGEDRTMAYISIGSTKGNISVQWDIVLGDTYGPTGLLPQITAPTKLDVICKLNRAEASFPVLILTLYPGNKNDGYAYGEVKDVAIIEELYH